MTPDELRALLGGATAGPWRVDHRKDGVPCIGVDLAHPADAVSVLFEGDWGITLDAIVIVALRNHAEALLELWEATALWRKSGTVALSRVDDALDRLEAT